MFNYEIIFVWGTHEAFNLEQRLHIIELIEKKYLIKREKHPDIFIYDLTHFFVSLREHVSTNCVAESNEGNYSEVQPERVEELNSAIELRDKEIKELKEQIQRLNQTINEKNQEMKTLKNTINELTIEKSTPEE